MGDALTLEGLIRFHQETLAPELQRIAARLDEHTALHRETHSHLDAVYRKLDDLEHEYHAIRDALQRLERRMAMVEVRVGKLEERVSRVEDRLGVVDQKLDHDAMRAELQQLELRVSRLEQRLSQLNKEISSGAGC